MSNYDNYATVNGNAVGSLTTPSFTVGSGSNRAAVAMVNWVQTGITISSVTGAGGTWTSAGARANNGSACGQIYKTAAPSSGSQTVTVNFSDTWGSQQVLVAVTASDVDQTTPTADYTSATGTSTTPSVTVPNVGSSDLILDICMMPGGGAETIGADQTLIHNDTTYTTVVSRQAGTAGGAMSWTNEFSTSWVTVALRLVNAAGGTNYTRTLSDSVAVVESPARGVRAYRAVYEAASLNELLARSQAHIRIASDQFVISDELRRAANAFRQVHDDIAINDDLLRFTTLFRKLLDSPTVTDALASTITLGGTLIITRTLRDDISVEELIARTVRAYRLESQVVDVSDGTWYSASVTRLAVEVLTLADATARALVRNRIVGESVEAADIAVRYALLDRLLRDQADATDSMSREIVYFQQLIGFVLMGLRNEPIVLNLDASSIELSLVLSQPISMEMSNQ